MDPSAYLLVLLNHRQRSVQVGKLGRLHFAPGYYVYVGSGGSNVLKRVKRHMRPTKPLRWHLDYITSGPRRMRPFDSYVMPQRDECDLARHLGLNLEVVRGFGSSDCRCPGHLYHAPDFAVLKRALDPLVGSGR
jgi:Uri superfamily endonuclease